MNPSEIKIKIHEAIELFKLYHAKYPTHGYRWLNAKICLDLGQKYSDNYAQRVCSYVGIRSISKQFYRYKSHDRFKIYPNLLFIDLNIYGVMQVVVSDMTAFWCNDVYYELTTLFGYV